MPMEHGCKYLQMYTKGDVFVDIYARLEELNDYKFFDIEREKFSITVLYNHWYLKVYKERLFGNRDIYRS